MRFLVDIQLLVWAAEKPERLSPIALETITSDSNELIYSLASLWEIAIKSSLGRPDFQVHPSVLRQGLLTSGYRELAIRAEHVIGVMSLPSFHKDPFDRMLVAQAAVEGLALLTADRTLSRYSDHAAIQVA